MYIGGNPGTGKTALVNEVVDELKAGCRSTIHVIKVNCMLVGDAGSVYAQILEQCQGHAKVSHEKTDKAQILDALFTDPTSDSKYLLLLDEIDRLAQRGAAVLYHIFEWPFRRNSRVSVIGIANALDLTERIVPLLKAHRAEPRLLYFPQYSIDDITAILCDRLSRANELVSTMLVEEAENMPAALQRLALVNPTAIELCARKTAAVGDLRKALDIIKYVFPVEPIMYDDARRQSIMLAEEDFGASKQADGLAGKGGHCTDIFPEGPRFAGELVKLTHVLKVLDQQFGAGSSSSSIIDQLGLHAKVALCAHVLLSGGSNPRPTLLALYSRYNVMAKEIGLPDGIGRSEFLDVAGNLEASGVWQPAKIRGRLAWESRIALLPALEDVKTRLCRMSLLRGYLQ